MNTDIEITIKDGIQSFRLPSYTTEGSAGADVYALLSSPVVLTPGERKLIPTGLFAQIPKGFEIQVRPRSGLALNHGITVLNSPGTIDSDYRGEIGVILINLGSEPFTIQNGERIAQIVVSPIVRVRFTLSPDLSDSSRGSAGFGSTGTN